VANKQRLQRRRRALEASGTYLAVQQRRVEQTPDVLRLDLRQVKLLKKRSAERAKKKIEVS
jgi:hypothetical protein